jgi:hypothetical protein
MKHDILPADYHAVSQFYWHKACQRDMARLAAAVATGSRARWQVRCGLTSVRPAPARSADGCSALGKERVADLDAVVGLAWVEIL